MKKLLLIITLAMLSTSCMTTKTSVGNYDQQEGEKEKFDKDRSVWILWGIVPISQADAKTPRDGDCLVRTKMKLVDFLVFGITGGFVITYSVDVFVKEEEEN